MIANGPLTIVKANVTNSRERGTVHTQVNGITIGYSDQGTGLPIVFLHAFPLNRTMWATQETPLSSQFRIITIDLRGHGESDAPLWRYTLDQSADDVRALLDHLGIQQAVFVGLSMGGYILFAFYRKYAARVKGLILADTKAQADTAEGKDGRFQMAQIAYKQGPPAIADLMIPKLLSPRDYPDEPGSRPARESHDRGQSGQRYRRRLDGDGRTARFSPTLDPDHLPHPDHRRRTGPSNPALRCEAHGRANPPRPRWPSFQMPHTWRTSNSQNL